MPARTFKRDDCDSVAPISITPISAAAIWLPLRHPMHQRQQRELQRFDLPLKTPFLNAGVCQAHRVSGSLITYQPLLESARR